MNRTGDKETIERDARDEMVHVTEQYLNEEITTFQFDDALQEIAWYTEDETVREQRIAFWCLYNDMTNHTVDLDKSDWDYCQRVLLLLKSDARIESSVRRRWTARQAMAASCLALFLVALAALGFGRHLILIVPALGIVSMALAATQPRTSESLTSWVDIPMGLLHRLSSKGESL